MAGYSVQRREGTEEMIIPREGAESYRKKKKMIGN